MLGLIHPPPFLSPQRLNGRIEDLSTGDLSKMDYEHFLLILQNLKERAIELQSQIEQTRELNNPEHERSELNSLQNELISVMPMMNLVRTLVKMEALYRSSGTEEASLISSKAGGLNKAKQAEIRVSALLCTQHWLAQVILLRYT